MIGKEVGKFLKDEKENIRRFIFLIALNEGRVNNFMIKNATIRTQNSST
jgi:hypothetical protein